LREKLGHGHLAATFAVAGNKFIDLFTQALEGLVQGVEIGSDDAEQCLTLRPTPAKFDVSAAWQHLYENCRAIALEEDTGNPGPLRVAYKSMQPDRKTADYAFGQKVIVIAQYKILGLPRMRKCSRFSGWQQLWGKPYLWFAVSQQIAKFEALHQRQKLGVHVGIHGISPDALAIGTIETAELSLHSLVIEDPKDGIGGPGVLQDDCTS